MHRIEHPLETLESIVTTRAGRVLGDEHHLDVLRREVVAVGGDTIDQVRGGWRDLRRALPREHGLQQGVPCRWVTVGVLLKVALRGVAEEPANCPRGRGFSLLLDT